MEELFSKLKITETDDVGAIGTEFDRNVQQTEFWAHGAWFDILAKVFEYLPIRERVRMERVCKLFKNASKISWGIVRVLELPSDVYSGEKFKLILDSYSQRIPKNCKIHLLNLPPLFARCHACESRGMFTYYFPPVCSSGKEEDIAKSVQKFYLPSLKYLGVFYDCLAGGQALVRLAKAHPTVENLDLKFMHQVDWSTIDEESSPQKIIENLPNLKGLKVSIAEQIQRPRQIFPKIAPSLEIFHLVGQFDFTNVPSFKLPSLKEMSLDFRPSVVATYPVPLGVKNLAQSAPQLTRLLICFPTLYISIEEAGAISRLPLEALNLEIGVAEIEWSVLRLIEELAHNQSTTRITLQHLMLSLSTPKIGNATDTNAYLDFRSLKTLRIQSIYSGDRELMWPFGPDVYIALNGKLDHLEIPAPSFGGREIIGIPGFHLNVLINALLVCVQDGFPEDPQHGLCRGFSCYTKHRNFVHISFTKDNTTGKFRVYYTLME